MREKIKRLARLLIKELFIYEHLYEITHETTHVISHKIVINKLSKNMHRTNETCRSSIHLADGSLTIRYREVSKPRDSGFDFPIALKFDSHLSSSACRAASCQISERYDHYNIQSHGFEASRDLVVRRLTAYWIHLGVCVYQSDSMC